MPVTQRPDPQPVPPVPLPPPSRPEPPRVPPQPLVPSTAGGLLPAPAADPVVDQLLAERIVLLTGEVDDSAAHRVVARLLLLAAQDPERDIALYVHSPGGSAVAGLAIHDTMQAVAPDVATWAVGLAASVGQFLVSAGAPGKRYALPHARIVLRPPSAGPGANAEAFGEMKRELTELTARHTGQDVETVLADAGRWFTAAQAQEYGLVDHVATG